MLGKKVILWKNSTENTSGHTYKGINCGFLAYLFLETQLLKFSLRKPHRMAALWGWNYAIWHHDRACQPGPVPRPSQEQSRTCSSGFSLGIRTGQWLWSSWKEIRSKIRLSTLSGELSARNWSSIFPRRIPFCDCFSLQLVQLSL